MSSSELPARPSLDYLRKLAKERLEALRERDPEAKLSRAQLELARVHGFASWRALKAEVDRRRDESVAEFFDLCRRGDVPALSALLATDPALARARGPENETALHVAAGAGALESVRALLDVGADVHGPGDLHQAGVIGWATGNGVRVARDVVALLLERGARHHIFSAIALGDRALVEGLVLDDPQLLSARRSRFENEQTPLHFALFAPDGLESHAPDYAMAQLLLELGADPDTADGRGRTPYERALLADDREALALLSAYGATAPSPPSSVVAPTALAAVLASVRRQVPMLRVADLTASVAWYTALGFRLQARHPPDGEMNFALLACGDSELMLVPGGAAATERGVSVWFYTERVAELYGLLKARKLAGTDSAELEPRFEADLYTPFYGGREFSIRDPNGVSLVFKTP